MATLDAEDDSKRFPIGRKAGSACDFPRDVDDKFVLRHKSFHDFLVVSS
jgi:hypothetical protein